MKLAAGWLLAAIGVALVVALVLWAGDEWSEAIVQGLAALGGLWYWAFRSRPRVTLRLRNSNGLYLELANVGHRVAKQVTVRCNPPIPWEIAPREEFGPVEDFGDMDRGQRYVVLVGSPGPHIVDVAEYDDLRGVTRKHLGVQAAQVNSPVRWFGGAQLPWRGHWHAYRRDRRDSQETGKEPGEDWEGDRDCGASSAPASGRGR